MEFQEPLQSTGRRVKDALASVALVVPVGVLAGSASALFLWSLHWVTRIRWENPWLLWLLPVGGVAVAWLYSRFGDKSAQGNNLIIEEIHAPGGGVPRRMAPLVLFATLVTHLFGGSAGREGTAVQMGGSLAAAYGKLFAIGRARMRMLLMAGVAAGFASVFGTPVTGAIFALEVLTMGQIKHDEIVPMLAASVVGHLVCHAWGIHHAAIVLSGAEVSRGWFELGMLGKAAGAGICFGLVGQLFVATEHGVKHLCAKVSPIPYLRPVIGGVVIIGLTYALGTRDYLGLSVGEGAPGVVTLRTCFQAGGVDGLSWFWKLLFTAITLGAGFKGGEVTPLFFIGAALGNMLGVWMGMPIDMAAALGFVAVFAGASNTPLACTVMGVELFGGQYTVYFATACFFAYFFSGHRGIYSAQRRGDGKGAT